MAAEQLLVPGIDKAEDVFHPIPAAHEEHAGVFCLRPVGGLQFAGHVAADGYAHAVGCDDGIACMKLNGEIVEMDALGLQGCEFPVDNFYEATETIAYLYGHVF